MVPHLDTSSGFLRDVLPSNENVGVTALLHCLFVRPKSFSLLFLFCPQSDDGGHIMRLALWYCDTIDCGIVIQRMQLFVYTPSLVTINLIHS